MKYQCDGCGHVFDEEDAHRKTYYSVWGKAVEDIDSCPRCRSEKLIVAEDVEKVDRRGEWLMECERNGD